jgi:DamX protein
MNTEEQTQLSVSAGPVGTGGDAAFFYSPELAQRLDLLRHLTESSDLIPLVKGPEGAGKSTLIDQIIARATENWLLCHIEATPMLQPEQLFTQLASAFTTTIGGGDALDILGQRFADLRREGSLPVIIIDDAHLLPEISIITLLQLYARLPEDSPMVRILLFAQPEIDSILESPQVQSMGPSVLQVLDMPLLKKEQTFAFIDHILAAADSSGSLRLSSAQSEKIHVESGGLPGKVEQLVLESMRTGIIQWGAARLSSVSPLTTVATIIGVVALLLILIFQDSINSLFGGPEVEVVEPQAELPAEGTVSLALPPTPIVDPPVAVTPPSEMVATPATPVVPPEPPEINQPEKKAAAEDGQIDAVTDVQTESVVAVEPPVETTVVTEPEPASGQQSTVPTVEEAATEPVVVEDTVPPPSPQAVVQPPQQEPEPTALPAEEVPVAEAEAPVPVVPEVVSADEEVAVAPEDEAAPVEEAMRWEPIEVEKSSAPLPPKEEPVVKPAAPKPAPVRDATPPKAKAGQQVSTTGVKQEAWLLQQRPENYTLQLIGLRDAQGIPRFIKRNSLNGQAAYFRTSHQGQPWFVVLYGVYPNRGAAVKARSKLPPKLRGTGVWPRSFGSVQKEIRNR